MVAGLLGEPATTIGAVVITAEGEAFTVTVALVLLHPVALSV